MSLIEERIIGGVNGYYFGKGESWGESEYKGLIYENLA